MKHANDNDRQLSAKEQKALGELQSGPQRGESIPVTRQMLGWLASLADGGEVATKQAPAPAVVPDAKAGTSTTKEVIEGSAFVQGAGDANAIDQNDVKQGSLGNCYFVAMLAAVAKLRPDVIQKMVKDNGNNTYTVSFQVLAGLSGAFRQWSTKEVVVDSEFWTGGGKQPTYSKTSGDTNAAAKGPELWVMLIEKAWATVIGNYAQFEGGGMQGVYDAFGSVTGTEGSHKPTSMFSDADLAKLIEDNFARKTPVLFWSNSTNTPEMAAAGVVGNHEYAISAASGGKFSLYNPWGFQHVNNVDAAFIKLHFQQVHVLPIADRLGPAPTETTAASTTATPPPTPK